jgi:NAD(P)-dependent dehydrogenase (short-subunit alcohol dehydrogenase family)
VAVPTDVTDPGSVKEIVTATVEAFGLPDVLVNNAGIAVFADPLKLPDEDWQRGATLVVDGGRSVLYQE